MQQITSKMEDLESRSKELYELLFLEKFTVKKVIATSRPISFITSEVIGVRLPTHEGGFTSKLVLEVTPENYNVPIRILNFNGYSIVKRNDYISAKIPRYEEKKSGKILFECSPFKTSEILYFDREFNREETAVEINILSTDDEILRTDRSVDYDKFVKSK